ncbi:hypothetical protein A9K55_006200 [Cordyceps militaris]|uniref:DUF8004 domain-containing protein n=1 Tax=Cordyceps militaris TaxID=73501 RepID=A0A2H4SCJ7_CORMI|nr:hypothetical protein A9K55_006200 [Cordyceps militaris]
MLSTDSQRHHDGEMRAAAAPTMKLWDGRNRTTIEWSGPHRESHLWTANGNCRVYLYGKGQCNAGASFRVDFATLLKTQCHIFIEKYMDSSSHTLDKSKTDVNGNRLGPRRNVSLYIPAAPGSTRSEIARQHLSVRNLLAWVGGVPLVGAHLGGEIVTLFRNMVTYRLPDTDSIVDLLAYLEALGYLDMVAQPNHALATLYVAEYLRHRDLYTRAFVHCVGMGDRIYQSSEYTKISLVSRKLIRAASRDLKMKLNGAIEDLGSFLEEELSESRIGLPHGMRTHLDRFRTVLLTFYTAKFGYFPPQDFDAKAVRAMLEDFEALYDLLVDDRVGAAGMFGGNPGGGLCILQILKTFDSRNSFKTCQHPLPLLPDASEIRKTRRMSWLGRGDMEKPAHRLIAHTALIKASNCRESSNKNALVRTYHDFEGKSLEPSVDKGGKPCTVSITDARKVRWILIYAMCQVLRSISQHAPQVAGEQAPYFLSASVAELPPWQTALDTTVELDMSSSALPTMPLPVDEPWQPRFADGVEIKPDIDYLALTHSAERQQPEKLRRRQSMLVAQATASPTRLSGMNYVPVTVLTRQSTIRNSIKRRLRPRTAHGASAASSPLSKSAYHEIVVEGYGNGTNEVKLERRNTVGCDNSEAGRWPPAILPHDASLPVMTTMVVASGAAPTVSCSSSKRSSNVSSMETSNSQSGSDPASPATISTPEFEQHAVVEPVIVRNSSHKSLTQRYPMKSVLDTISRTSSKRRASFASSIGKEPPLSSLPAPPQPPQSLPGSLSRAPSVRKSLLPESWTLPGRATLRQDIDEEDEMLALQAEADEWIAMQSFLDSDVSETQMAGSMVTPGWEQYHDLGGLTEVR